jgi:hypothetical protein
LGVVVIVVSLRLSVTLSTVLSFSCSGREKGKGEKETQQFTVRAKGNQTSTMAWDDGRSDSSGRLAGVPPTGSRALTDSRPGQNTIYRGEQWHDGREQPTHRVDLDDNSNNEMNRKRPKRTIRRRVVGQRSPVSFANGPQVLDQDRCPADQEGPEPASPSGPSSPVSLKTGKLRSASRSSKNTHLKPAETPEQHRTRVSHNLVEKQYRSRLNAEFQGLLNALPEQIRNTKDSGEDDSGPGVMDLSEKRVSKAEVLDMACQHIWLLEREHAQLENERQELLGSIDKLQTSRKRAREQNRRNPAAPYKAEDPDIGPLMKSED